MGAPFSPVLETYREIPEGLKICKDALSADEIAEADAIRHEFLVEGQSVPYMQDIVRAFRKLKGKWTYAEIGTTDRSNLAYAASLLADDALLIGVFSNADETADAMIRSRLKSGQNYIFLKGDPRKIDTASEMSRLLGKRKLDALFIDRDNTAYAVMTDYAYFSPMLGSGGFAMFHDCLWEGNHQYKGAADALAEIDRFEPVYLVPGFGECRRFARPLFRDPTWGVVGFCFPAHTQAVNKSTQKLAPKPAKSAAIVKDRTTLETQIPLKHPTLICIGAQRSGTTWLAKALQEHGSFWLPGNKEYNYLARFPRNRVLDRKAYDRLARKSWLFFGGRDKHWWKIYTRDWSLDNYAELFSLHEDKEYSADVSPSYSLLSEGEIRAAQYYLEGRPLLFLARNPIDRAWSATRKIMDDDPERNMDVVAYQMFDVYTRAFSDYAATIKRYRDVLQDCNLKIVFFDDIESRPAQVMSLLTRWLGIGPHPAELNPSLISSKRNAAREITLPDELRDAAEAYYAPFIEEFREVCKIPGILLSEDLPLWLTGTAPKTRPPAPVPQPQPQGFFRRLLSRRT
ncbi:sulfotransferase [Aestuariivirga litoralis]|uniref:sulfotransferase n=1 Tax=Aestuariivirga litoralis TaxID=2650924 RepID=UPI0018C69586|nr:sulfotransferase [Aestuariivirga litoralis]